MLVTGCALAGATLTALATATMRRLAQINHTGDGPERVQGLLVGTGIGAAIGLTVLVTLWLLAVWRARRWIAANRPYVEQMAALAVPDIDCQALHRAGVTPETLTPWAQAGATRALHWQLITQSGLTLDQARTWRAAGPDARFAAAATALGATLPDVRALVADYLEGTSHRADLDDAWIDLADGTDNNPTLRRPRQAEDLELATLLALPPHERRQLRQGQHPITWRFNHTPPEATGP